MSVQVFITKVVPSSLLATARTVVMNVTNLVVKKVFSFRFYGLQISLEMEWNTSERGSGE